MNFRPQSGMTLLEVVVAAAIVAIAAGAAFYAVASFGKHVALQGGVSRMAALVIAEQTLRVAQDAWKYGAPGNAPSGTQTIALPGSVTTVTSGNTSPAHITVTVRYTPEPGRSGDSGIVSVSGDIGQKAPLPGSQIDRPGLIALPSGAP